MADNEHEPAGLPPTVDRLRELTERYGRQRTAGSDTAHEVDALGDWVRDVRAGQEHSPPVTTTWDLSTPPLPREWLVPHWLPAGRLAMLSGKGGTGKSTLALQLAAGIAAGAGQWLPAPGETAAISITGAKARVAVYASYEDEAAEVTRRLYRMQPAWHGVKDRLHHWDCRRDGALWAAPPGSRNVSSMGAPTEAGQRLLSYTAAVGAAVLVIDPVVGAYAGNENDNTNVRAFLAWLDAWAERRRCTVLLIHHAAKYQPGEARGASDFVNGCRAVLSLDYNGTGEARAPWLYLDKANYSALTGGYREGVKVNANGDMRYGRRLTSGKHGILELAAAGSGETANGRTTNDRPRRRTLLATCWPTSARCCRT